MIWVGVSGSWRTSSPALKADVAREVTAALTAGKGIVTGGALGVDYDTTELVLQFAPDGSRLKVFLPTTLEIYAAHFRKRAAEGVITSEQAEQLIAQLKRVEQCGVLTVNTEQTPVNPTTYYLRDAEVVNASDELLAFQVNASAGTQDTIDKARAKGVPVKLFSYAIPS